MYAKGDAHAQRIMDNGAIIIPPQYFQHPSSWFYQEQEDKNMLARSSHIWHNIHRKCH
jgi:hypothetical protein